MSEEIKNNEVEEVEEDDGIYTLTDEDGNEEQFELLCSCEFEGGVYYAFVPAYKEDCEEYVILKAIEEVIDTTEGSELGKHGGGDNEIMRHLVS